MGCCQAADADSGPCCTAPLPSDLGTVGLPRQSVGIEPWIETGVVWEWQGRATTAPERPSSSMESSMGRNPATVLSVRISEIVTAHGRAEAQNHPMPILCMTGQNSMVASVRAPPIRRTKRMRALRVLRALRALRAASTAQPSNAASMHIFPIVSTQGKIKEPSCSARQNRKKSAKIIRSFATRQG